MMKKNKPVNNSNLQVKDSSQNSLEEIFNYAKEAKSAARFLRLGGPTRFRSEVIAISSGDYHNNKAFELLTNKNIPEIEFILNNPFSEPFLTRMDAEKKANWQIWRVRDQVIDFTYGLIRVNKYRKQNLSLSDIKIAFHNVDLIWNVGIAEDNHVIVRSYYKSSKGHYDKNSEEKEITECHLSPGQPDRLAESFESYYRSVKCDSKTTSIIFEKDLRTLGNWPSLFKGNAIITLPKTSSAFSDKKKPFCVETSEIEHEEFELSNRDRDVEKCQLVEKAYLSDSRRDAEVVWYSFQTNTHYLKPLKNVRKFTLKKPFRASTICMPMVNGITAAELLWIIEDIGETEPALIPKLGIMSGAITIQAFNALTEFRDTIEQNKNILDFKNKTQKYLWDQQLASAISEAGRFVIKNERKLCEYKEEATALGKSLHKYQNTAFRDASLKNRIVQMDVNFEKDNYQILRDRIKNSTYEELYEWLRTATVDIDFETCLSNVTQWDDPFHIIWFSNFEYSNVHDLLANLDSLKKWGWTPCPQEQLDVMWKTLLCRSLREYCRRLWYDQVMPLTYQHRYAKEDRDLFLYFAKAAAEKVAGYFKIRELIDECFNLEDSIWNRRHRRGKHKTIQAKFPNFSINPPPIVKSQKRSDCRIVGKKVVTSTSIDKSQSTADGLLKELEEMIETNMAISKNLMKHWKVSNEKDTLILQFLEELMNKTKNDSEKSSLAKLKSTIVDNKALLASCIDLITRLIPK